MPFDVFYRRISLPSVTKSTNCEDITGVIDAEHFGPASREDAEVSCLYVSLEIFLRSCSTALDLYLPVYRIDNNGFHFD